MKNHLTICFLIHFYPSVICLSLWYTTILYTKNKNFFEVPFLALQPVTNRGTTLHHHVTIICELCTSPLKFALQPKLGSTMCTLLLKEVVKYYLDNCSHVYSCFTDAMKAFDRVKHDELFLLLIQRLVSFIDIHILWQQYQTQKKRTSWNGCHSK